MGTTAIEDGLNIAVLIPCRDQAKTIGATVRGFRHALPAARIFVFDNNSSDDTARIATREGARVLREARDGRGSVVRRMFADIDADVYLLATCERGYDPGDAPSLVNALVTERVDMVVGTQRRPLAAGERAFDWLYRRSFPGAPSDIASGYRAFTHRFVKSFPAISTGFDVEIELSMHASQLMIPVAEIDLGDAGPDAANADRRPGVGSGMRAAAMLGMLLKETRPFAFFGAVAIVFWILGLSLMGPAVATELGSGMRGAAPHAFLGMSFFVAGFVSAACGLVLESLGRSRVEQKRVLFLTVPGLGAQ